MELREGEKIIFEGMLPYGDRMVFTNKRLLIMDSHKVTPVISFLDFFKSKDYVFSEFNLEDIKEVYTKTSRFTKFSSMILEFNDGNKLECYITGRGGAFRLMGSWPSLAYKRKSVVDRYVNLLRDAVNERKMKIDNKDKMFCRHCGCENPFDSVFCEKCGKKIK